MPLYDYSCNGCGPFEVWHKMAETAVPRNCPDCDAIASRIFTAPNISLGSSSLLKKVGSPEPRLVKRQSEPAKPRNQATRPGSRPWMIGHAAERL
ncbi:FmdB family zinc ribbon protein [cf. Phormidesmis sp. LEGE 11477]|uniref:FmdB family zinc ribbon protein n=1 Tax=cf. Phormidesmis sp. LEGE 11477 TaxID=1828680 RepID=UPI00187DEC0A|nr:zinc ribbon domain-containing protein [cf. Phormidesmis sp. LEGE 11477]MBE9062557.1 zinc ribbon domain-containing protein [cf. Phormidesmis sp. LEGE 11477]